MEILLQKARQLLETADFSLPPSSFLIACGTLLVLALVPIYIGSMLSLSNQSPEKMSMQDAYMFPVIGSGVLFGLYLLFKFIGKEYINVLLSAYFLFFGIAALESCLAPVLLLFASETARAQPPRYRYVLSVPLIKDPLEIAFGNHDIVATLFSAVFGLWYVWQKHWLANNTFGLAFAVQGIALLPLGSWKVGALLLVGLFFYDIFWVFATSVMVFVAKNFDAPVKLLFPRDIFAAESTFNMLGLGDIVIPGIFIAMMLRFDHKNAIAKRKHAGGSYPKPYFYSCFVAYLLGLFSTMAVMHVFKAAQPALLYLVPACLGSSLVTAFVRGEIGRLLRYKEDKKD